VRDKAEKITAFCTLYNRGFKQQMGRQKNEQKGGKHSPSLIFS
jgi:hypothetical protein